MEKIFNPQSLVVVGVSEKQNNLARAIAENVMAFGYAGKLYLAGQNEGEIKGRPIHDSIEKLPEGIDLAVILTPANTVAGYMEECGKKGIKYAIIESGGFSEFSEEGRAVENQIKAIADRYGMRFVGPNCIGINNTGNGICTIFVPVDPNEIKPGKVSLLAQSGGVVLTCTDALAAAGLGVSKTASVGNKTDYKESDYLKYFLEDDDTDIVVQYLESIDEGRELISQAARGIKPIIVYKSNTSEASAQVAQSHTAALANDDAVVDAAFKQFGIARARSLRDMTLIARGYSMPLMRGNRLAVFSRSGGHAIISVDLASEHGFVLPPFTQSLLQTAKQYFRADIMADSNPLDLGTVFNLDSYAHLIDETMKSMEIDGVMLIFNYRHDTIPQARRIAEDLKKIGLQYDKPIALVYFTEMDEVHHLEANLGYPVFEEVYDAMRALEVSRDFYAYQQKAHIATPRDGKPPEGAREKALGIINGRKGRALLTHEALEICDIYGLPVAAWVVAEDNESALKLAEKLGYPLVLKVSAEEIVHKSDFGGVVVNITDSVKLIAAMEKLGQKLADMGYQGMAKYLLQKMVSGGREVILGGKTDRGFGQVLLFGLGGIYVEAFNDVALRVAPIAKSEAQEMIADIKGSKLLRGVRGEAPSDVNAVIDALVKLSTLVMDLPEISEIEFNPLIVLEKGAKVVDARIILKE